MTIRLKSLIPDELGAFRMLLGSQDFGGCFCAVWTQFGPDWAARCGDPSQPNFNATANDLAGGRHVGFFVYQGSELVGWTGAGPKASFPLLSKKLGSRLSESQDRWSVGCIALRATYRGQNLSGEIVRAIMAEASARGAKTIEAYPVDPFDEARIYRGTFSLYNRLGFKEVARERDGNFDIVLMERSLSSEI